VETRFVLVSTALTMTIMSLAIRRHTFEEGDDESTIKIQS